MPLIALQRRLVLLGGRGGFVAVQGLPGGGVGKASRILGSVTFDFPDDLVRLQREWFAADAAHTEAALSEDGELFTATGERLQDLTMALHRHPWMQACESRYQARMALREAARHP